MKTKIPKPAPAQILIPCECERKVRSSLVPGHNDVNAVCDCGAVLHYCVNYDGHGMATIISGTIEKVEEK